MDEADRIVRTRAIEKCQCDVAQDVEFKYLRCRILTIFSRLDLEKIEGKNKSNAEIMFDLCRTASTLSKAGFFSLVDAIEFEYPHIAEKIKEVYEKAKEEAESKELAKEKSSNSLMHMAMAPASVTSKTQVQSDMKATLSLSVPGTSATSLAIISNQESSRECQPFVPGYTWMRRNTPDKVYPMETTPRGFALIINNIECKHLSKRSSSLEDGKKLFQMFHKIGFKVSQEFDKTAKEMLCLLRRFAKFRDMSKASALAVAILTHGWHDNLLFGTDGKLTDDGKPLEGTFFSELELYQTFLPDKCPAMKNKPKLFIIQACRGDNEDLPTPKERPTESTDSGSSQSQGAEMGARSMVHSSPGNANLPKEHPIECTDGGSRQSRTAEMGDMCVVHSSSPGYVAYRVEGVGSPFVDVLTESVVSLAPLMEFRDIIREVQSKMNVTMLQNGRMTMPDFIPWLIKSWYLNPPS